MDPVAQALADEVSRLQAEEAASATRAERAADPTIAPPPAPASTKAAGAAQVEQAMAMLQALPPELVTPLLIGALDIIVKRVALYAGGEEAKKKYALDEDEHAFLTKLWTPVVAHYMQQMHVHPLLMAGLGTGVVYGVKALPEGALEAALGGFGQKHAPQAVSPAPTTADLVRPEPRASSDRVLELAAQQAEALKRKREQEQRQ